MLGVKDMLLRRFCKPLLLAAALLGFASAVWADPVQAVLFTSPYCPHCRHLKEDGFPQQLRDKYAGTLELFEYDLTENDNNVLFSQTLEAYQLDSAGIPMLVIGETVLQGYPTQIASGADKAIEKARSKQEKTRVPGLPALEVKKPAPATKPAAQKPAQTAKTQKSGEVTAQDKPKAPAAEKETKPSQAAQPAQTVPAAAPETAADAQLQAHEALFSQITLWAIIGAGLADGINPCAFAVIVFFVSFLAAYKYTKKEIIIVGTAYCASVFLAYLLMGLGAFHFLYAMKGFRYVTLAVQWGTIALCVIFLALSLYDFIVYQRTKKSEKMLLQLPKSYKEYIHKVMRFFLKDKQSSMWRLLLAAFAVGFVVSGVEAVCTGQVYLPTCVVILKEAGSQSWKAAEYLIMYNLMFVLPLVLVFVLTLCGKESATFNNWLKKHLGLSKFLLCCVFLGLLLLMLANMF